MVTNLIANGRPRPTILVISQQHLMRWGNQVLYHFLAGLLRADFRVVLLTLETDDPNVADPRELFNGLDRQLRIVRFTPPAEAVTVLAKRVRDRFRGANGHSPSATTDDELPAPEQTLPFRADRTYLQLATLGTFTAGAVARARELAQQELIDVVCGYEVYGTPAARIVARQLGKPLVTKFQGTFLSSVPREQMWRRYPADYLGTRVDADLVFMLNDGTRGRQALLDVGIRPEKIRFDLCAVDKPIRLPAFDRAALLGRFGVDLNPNTRVLLSLSKLSHWKRVDRSIALMPGILAQWPDTYLVVAHRGEWADKLRRLAIRLGVGHRVIFTGPVPAAEVRYLVNASDLVVSTHDHSNLSIPVLEALECGRPVISIADGSTDGVLVDSENALLAPSDQLLSDLPGRVARVLADPAELQRLSANATAWADRNLQSWSQQGADQAAAIRALL